jgi:hypothetical protein
MTAPFTVCQSHLGQPKRDDVTYADDIARHRRERAAYSVATFGLWSSTHDWRAVHPKPTAVAGIGASEESPRRPNVDLTQQLIGATGGLLVDLGFQMCPIGAITNSTLPPTFLVWIAGMATTDVNDTRSRRSAHLGFRSTHARMPSPSGRTSSHRCSAKESTSSGSSSPQSRPESKSPSRVKQLVKRTTTERPGRRRTKRRRHGR